MNNNSIILLVIISLFSQMLMAQNLEKRTFTIGSEFAGFYANSKDWTTGEESCLFTNKVAPFFCYFPYNTTGLGVMGEYDFVVASFDYSRNDLWGVGVFIRHYLPHETLNVDFINQNVRFFLETSFLRTNYFPKKERTESDILPEQVTNHLDVDVIKLHVGATLAILKPFKFKYFKDLNLELSYRPEWYLGKNFQHTYRMGLEYNFYKSNK